ncbi:MAG: hypothetical protein DLM72_13555 [Candidatus Nitrosopolaris wilkensis]|nr:MAG: hypothetical protein DLM72_13555 [Candidatus Nitrosopolaris wilkensis]
MFDKNRTRYYLNQMRHVRLRTNQPSQERNETNNDGDLSNTEFSFKYAESGGLTNRYLLISYNSKTNIIGINITQKQPLNPMYRN